ncbi:hypothetical protein M758_10G164200 [Ceratodon purpureus]|nr:hypothetical protein M758_10G164200 [Ceratodon purpureus]
MHKKSSILLPVLFTLVTEFAQWTAYIAGRPNNAGMVWPQFFAKTPLHHLP